MGLMFQKGNKKPKCSYEKESVKKGLRVEQRVCRIIISILCNFGRSRETCCAVHDDTQRFFAAYCTILFHTYPHGSFFRAESWVSKNAFFNAFVTVDMANYDN